MKFRNYRSFAPLMAFHRALSTVSVAGIFQHPPESPVERVSSMYEKPSMILACKSAFIQLHGFLKIIFMARFGKM
jgi:hypothetical protein